MPDPPPGTREDLRDLSLRLILLLGAASLFGSLVSNGARSVTGPYLLLLGGSAAIIGLVAGAGEFIGYALRSATGIYVGRNHRYWKAATAGYSLLAAIPFLAVAGRWENAAVLIIAERIGKAVRTPARDTILSHATTAVGRGWGFGVHKALDQVGAVAGPLVMAAALAVTGGYAQGFLLLGIPLAGVPIALFLGRSEVPRPGCLEEEGEGKAEGDDLPGIVPYAAFIFLGMAGFASFPLISFHLKAQSVVPDAAIPLFYAAAMTVSVAVALLVGRIFDRAGTHVLLAIPALSITTAVLAFSPEPAVAVAGSLIWGAGIGIFEPVLRASIAESTTTDRRGRVYGSVTAVFGTAWFVGSAVMGVLYDVSIGHIVAYVVIVEVAAVAAYLWMCRSRIAVRLQEGLGDIIP
ncbi:MFS transporter [Methanoculleus horonobensis]|uniref:MFS transporter n=1 Tax=Methanoculleus horonobensis TaxID=528314 RepID=UPI0008354851|nr:MFS transporter [Methanoculleus horonobensis]MDD3071189.1 MFS transporter [Methanoculleus horonobensis]MDD4252773.1 MFS transporter [Methanoculleus horonobensis]